MRHAYLERPNDLIGTKDFAAIEKELLAAGHRTVADRQPAREQGRAVTARVLPGVN